MWRGSSSHPQRRRAHQRVHHATPIDRQALRLRWRGRGNTSPASGRAGPEARPANQKADAHRDHRRVQSEPHGGTEPLCDGQRNRQQQAKVGVLCELGTPAIPAAWTPAQRSPKGRTRNRREKVRVLWPRPARELGGLSSSRPELPSLRKAESL